MAKSPKKVSAHQSGHRSGWKGQLSIGLVSVGVEAFNALDRERGDIHFHQIHAKCHHRIHYQKVCPIHGEVNNDEIVSGYEYKKGKYVELDPKELQSLRKQSDRALKLEAFVPVDAVDPLYFDGRMYYLAPDGPQARTSYSVIVEAMAHQNRCGIGHLILSGKEQMAFLRPYEGILHMAMLNFHTEIRPPETVVSLGKSAKAPDREVRMAESLIEEWSDTKFDYSHYEDTHRESVEAVIAKKIRGGKIVEAEEEEEEAPPVLNLMDALKRSIRRTPGRTGAKKKSVRRTA